MKIADISVYQGDIDWNKARNDLDMAIFRASVGSNMDTKYLFNASTCRIPYGAYHYVKAVTAAEAEAEADFFVACANQARPLFYIADIEHETQNENTTEAVCVAFLKRLRLLGCKRIGMYINTKYKWAGSSIDMCDIMWIPHWGLNDGKIPEEKYAPKHPCDLWQFTSVGRVDGINTVVDLNIPRDGRTLQWFTQGYEETKGDDSGVLTNLMLAQYCEKVYADRWVYWYGTCGYECSKSLYERKKVQYPDQYGSGRTSGYMADISNGKMCADCVGLIKSFFWKGGDIKATNVYQSHGCPDRSADGLFAMCSERGDIKTIPNIPGLVVHKGGHIGVYVGDGYTIELKGFAYDCVKNRVSDGPWTEWGRLPSSMLAYVDGVTGDATPEIELGARVLKRGCVGADVKELQEALLSLGYTMPRYGADGDYGDETVNAVTKFQKDRGLTADGVFGASTLKALKEMIINDKPIEEQPTQDTPDDGGAPAYVLIVSGDEKTLRAIMAEYGGTLAAVDSVKVV